MKFQSPMRDRQMLRRTEKPTVGRWHGNETTVVMMFFLQIFFGRFNNRGILGIPRKTPQALVGNK